MSSSARILPSLVLALVFISGAGAAELPRIRAFRDKASGLVHPGIMLNPVQIKRLRDHIAAGDEPWKSGFDWFLNYHVKGKGVVCGPNPRVYYMDWTQIDDPKIDDRMAWDGETAWLQVVAYALTGNVKNYENACAILRRYTENIRGGKGHWDAHFRFAIAMKWFCAAAELLKYIEPPSHAVPWSAADDEKFLALMEIGAGWADSRNAWMNQHQFCTAGLMAYAIFRNDGGRYREMVERATANSRSGEWGGNGGYGAMARWVESGNGEEGGGKRFVEWAEMGRDIGHPFAGAWASIETIKIMVSQGTKVDAETGECFSRKERKDFANSAASASLRETNPVHPLAFRDDALVRGVNYIYRYNLGFDCEWVPIDTKDTKAGVFERISNKGGGRGRIPGGAEYLYDYYRYVRGWKDGEPDFKFIAWSHRVLGREFPDAFLFMPEQAKGTAGEIYSGLVGEFDGSTRLRHFANWFLPDDSGAKRMKDEAEGRFVRLSKGDTVLPLFVKNGTFLGEGGPFEIRYRAAGKAGVQLINPEDYGTEKDESGKYKPVARFALPATDGEWRTEEVALPDTVNRELVKLRFATRTPPLDLAWVRLL